MSAQQQGLLKEFSHSRLGGGDPKYISPCALAAWVVVMPALSCSSEGQRQPLHLLRLLLLLLLSQADLVSPVPPAPPPLSRSLVCYARCGVNSRDHFRDPHTPVVLK